VFAASEGYYTAAQSSGVSLVDAKLRQGSGGAVESVTVYNDGSLALSSFTLVTAGIPNSASYCYSLLNPTTQMTITSTCPTMSTNPTAITFAAYVPPDSSVTALLILSGQVFAIGSTYELVVSAPTGAQQSVRIIALPA